MPVDVYNPEVGQSPAELRQAVQLYKDAQPYRVLEIGVLFGGTLRQWLDNARPGATIVAIDPNHINGSHYEEWRPDDVELVVGYGFSQSSQMVDLIREHAPYDFVFIDGDHTLEAVQADADLALDCARAGSLILFHDIIPPDGAGATPPGRVFESMPVEHSWVIIEPRPPGYPPESANGIGVIRIGDGQGLVGE
jgi:predicted O-methyltransferase YrrM